MVLVSCAHPGCNSKTGVFPALLIRWLVPSNRSSLSAVVARMRLWKLCQETCNDGCSEYPHSLKSSLWPVAVCRGYWNSFPELKPWSSAKKETKNDSINGSWAAEINGNECVVKWLILRKIHGSRRRIEGNAGANPIYLSVQRNVRNASTKKILRDKHVAWPLGRYNSIRFCHASPCICRAGISIPSTQRHIDNTPDMKGDAILVNRHSNQWAPSTMALNMGRYPRLSARVSESCILNQTTKGDNQVNLFKA